jgi:hypothetical protein
MPGPAKAFALIYGILPFTFGRIERFLSNLGKYRHRWICLCRIRKLLAVLMGGVAAERIQRRCGAEGTVLPFGASFGMSRLWASDTIYTNKERSDREHFPNEDLAGYGQL